MTFRTVSQLLQDVKTQLSGEFVSIEQILEEFHERGFGFLLFLFALPAAIPLPAMGVNLIIAFPLLLLTAQQALGKHTVWLPQKIKTKKIHREKLNTIIDKSTPWLERMERLIKPRLDFMTQGFAVNLVGVMGFMMALSVCVPLPLTNTVPSFGIAMMAAGVMMRDGLAIIAGAIIGILWICTLVFVGLFFGVEGFEMIKNAIISFL